MEMPLPDAATIARRDEIAAALRQIVPGEGVIVSEPQRRAYESDGLTAYRQPPLVVVLPSTVAQVAAVLRYCKDESIKVVPRGAGTSLSGGALPLADGVLLGSTLTTLFSSAAPSSGSTPSSASPGRTISRSPAR